MLRYTFNLICNLPNITVDYIEYKLIEFYNSILIQPKEEIEMTILDTDHIIMTQPSKIKIS